jgi:ADP-ribose pyrophosphatase YjhB (NUDIX family)
MTALALLAAGAFKTWELARSLWTLPLIWFQCLAKPWWSVALPTSTAILVKEGGDPGTITAIKWDQSKEGGRLAVPGGKVNLFLRESHVDCIRRELAEELGSDLRVAKIEMLFTKTDIYSANRPPVSLAKALEDSGRRWLKSLRWITRWIPVDGRYGTPDVIYLVTYSGTPQCTKEARKIVPFNVRDIEIAADPNKSKWGANHDLIVGLYRLYIEGKTLNWNQLLSDLTALRIELPHLL